MSRRIISIFFISTMLLNSSVMLFFYFGEMQVHKLEMKEYIVYVKNFKSGMLTAFTSGQNDFELVNDDEIKWNGKMYDIVKTEEKDNSKIYYTVKDDDEDCLYNDIIHLTKQNNNSTHLPSRRLNLRFLTFLNSNENLLNIQYDLIHIQKWRINEEYYCSPVKGVLSPPPKNDSRILI